MNITRIGLLALLACGVCLHAQDKISIRPVREKEAPSRPNPPKGGEQLPPHLLAAESYEKRARHLERGAAEMDSPEAKSALLAAAENCRKLAAMKREAYEFEQKGRPYDWGPYEKLKGETEELVRKGRGADRVEKPEVKPDIRPLELKPEARNLPEEIKAPVERRESFKTSSGFEVKTRIED